MKQWMLGLCGVLTLLTPTVSYSAESKAEMKENGVLGITSIYSESIQPQGGDEFTIILADDEGNTTECIFQAYEHQKNAQFFELEPGNYSVYDITYNGKSENIITEGFIMPLEFTVYEQEHLDTSLAIGKEKGTDLASTYVKTYSVINEEATDWVEYYSPGNMSETTDNEMSSDTNNREDGDAEKNTPSKEELTETEGADTTDKTTDSIEEMSVSKEEKEETAVEKPNLFLKNFPIVIIMGVTAIAVFILHKKGKI